MSKRTFTASFENQPKGWRFPARLLPVLLAIVSVIVTWMFVQWVPLNPHWQPLLFGILCAATLLGQRWIIYGVLTLAIIGMLNDFRANTYSTHVRVENVLNVLVFMAYVVFTLRYTDLRAPIRLLMSKSSKSKGNNVDVVKPPSGQWVSVRPIRSGILWIPIALLIAVGILWLIPIDELSHERFRIRPTGMRAITMVWFLAFAWWAMESTLQFLSRRIDDADWAGVYVRCVYNNELRREISGIEARRAKKIKKNHSFNE